MFRSFLSAFFGLWLVVGPVFAQANADVEALLLNEQQLCAGATSLAIGDVRIFVERQAINAELLEPNDSRRALNSLMRIDDMVAAGICPPNYQDLICPTAQLFIRRLNTFGDYSSYTDNVDEIPLMARETIDTLIDANLWYHFSICNDGSIPEQPEL